MGWARRTIFAAVLLGGASVALAQSDPPSPSATQGAALIAPAAITIPAGTTIVMEFTETLSSRTSQTGQLVTLRLVEPIVVDGRIIVEAGALGGGEVIDAARSGIGGRNGKLIVSGRFMNVAGQRARIRGLQVVIAGEDNSREAFAIMNVVPYVGWMGGFISGGDIEIPAGTRAQARFAADVVVPLSALPAAGRAESATAELTAPTAPEEPQATNVEATQ